MQVSHFSRPILSILKILFILSSLFLPVPRRHRLRSGVITPFIIRPSPWPYLAKCHGVSGRKITVHENGVELGHSESIPVSWEMRDETY